MSNTLLQPAAFLALVYGGIVAGMIYDVFRLIRRIVKWRFFHVLCDIVAVFGCLLACGAALLFATGGEIRPYLLVAFLAGIFLQQFSFSYLFFRAFYAFRAKIIKPE